MTDSATLFQICLLPWPFFLPIPLFSPSTVPHSLLPFYLLLSPELLPLFMETDFFYAPASLPYFHLLPLSLTLLSSFGASEKWDGGGRLLDLCPGLLTGSS